jgi:hypothetical protein
MSEDKLIVRLEIDESSIDKSISSISEKTKEGIETGAYVGLQGAIDRLAGSVDALARSFDGSISSSTNYSNSLNEVAASANQSSSALSSFSGAVAATGGAVAGFSNGVVDMYNFFNTAPERINNFIDKLLYVLRVLKDLVKFTNLNKYPLFEKLPGILNVISLAVDANRDTIVALIEKYKSFEGLKASLAGFFSAVVTGLKAIAVAVVAAMAGLFSFFLFITKDLSQALFLFTGTLAQVGSSIVSFIKSIPGLISGLIATFAGMSNALKQDFDTITGVFSGSTKSLYGLADATAAISSKLVLMAIGVNALEGPFESAMGTVLALSSALATLATVVIVGLIFKVGHLAQEIGGKLAASFRTAYESFLQFRKETLIFTATISAYNKETQEAIGSTEEWEAQVASLSKTFNFTQGELRKAAAEVVAVGTRLGLAKEQTQQLLTVSAEYARISGKDLFDTTVAFASALQGNSQSVLSYGVKLSEASNEMFAFKHGMSETFGQMSEQQKIQVRFNNLLGQYNTIQGIGATLANDWFQQTEKLNVSLDNFRNQVGTGAAYVEDLNLGASLLNKTLSLIPDSLARVAGLFGAFGARVLQATGYLIEFSFKLFLVYKGFLLLDAVLKTNTFTALANQTIPKLNVSLVQLAKNLGSTTASFAGLKASGKTLAEVFKNNKESIMSFIFGTQAAGSATTGIMSLIGARISGAGALVTTALRTILVAIGPFLLKAAAIAAAVTLIVKTFTSLEEKTQVFSLLLDSAKTALDEIAAGFGGMSGVMESFLATAKDVLGIGFGTLVYGLAKSMQVLVSVAAKAAEVFGSESAKSLNLASQNLENLSENLVMARFNFLALGEAALASESIKPPEFKEWEKLNELITALKDETTSSLKKIAEEQQSRIELVNRAVMSEVRTLQQAEEMKAQIRIAAQKKTLETLATELGSAAEKSNSIIVKEYNDRQRIINEALARNLITQEQFNNYRLDNEKKMNEELEKIADNHAKNQEDLVEKVMNTFGITAKQAERAIDIASAQADAASKLVTGTFERMGMAIIKGGEAWADYKGFVLNILGDFAIQVGTLVMGISKAVSAVAASLSSLNPVAGFIAGAALIAIGGMLKAMANAKPNTTGAIGTAGGFIGPNAGTSPDPAVAPRAETEREEKNPNVVINIEGSLFSTEETSRTIIGMISQEFDKSGAQIRRRGFT